MNKHMLLYTSELIATCRGYKNNKKEGMLYFTSCKSENQFTQINTALVSRRLSERKLVLAVTDKKDVRDTNEETTKS